jgi:hypothetical protein
MLLGGISCIVNSKIRLFRYKILDSFFLLLIFWSCFHVVIQWKNTGEFYGYRFLISLLPFSALGFAILCEQLWVKYDKIIIWSITALCFYNFFIILPFEFTEKTNLQPNIITPMGGCGWGNNAYVLNAAEFYFKSDAKTLIGTFLRGYLGASIFGLISLFGMNLARFGENVENRFTLSSYKSYVIFLYPVFIETWFFILKNKLKKALK